MFQILLYVFVIFFMSANSAWACTPATPDRIAKFGDPTVVRTQKMWGPGCDLPFPGKLPKPFPQTELGLSKLPKPRPPNVRYMETEVNYTVTLETEAANFPNCGQIKDKYKSYEKSMARISELAKKIESEDPLTSIEIQKLEKLVAVMPELEQEVRQSVLLTVKWDFRTWLPRSYDHTWFLWLFGIGDFKYFTARGPALLWDRTDSNQPDFLYIDDSNSQVLVSYQVPILDFCFGDSFMTLAGKDEKLLPPNAIEGPPFSNQRVIPVLKAEWKRDLKEKVQMGRWNIDRSVRVF